MAKIFDWMLTVKRLEGNEAFAQEIVSMFFEELPRTQQYVNKAYEKKDFTEMYNHLHKLNGSCSFVSVVALKNIVHAYCVLLTNPPADTFDAENKKLLTAFNHTVDAVLKEYNNASA